MQNVRAFFISPRHYFWELFVYYGNLLYYMGIILIFDDHFEG